MTIVSALKKLHKKMTGKDATGMTVANVVNSLSENYSGEGGGGGGDGFVTIHGSVNMSQGLSSFTIDETDEELIAAAESGKPILLNWTLITAADQLSIPEYHICETAVALEQNACIINALLNLDIDGVEGTADFMKVEIKVNVGGEGRDIDFSPLQLKGFTDYTFIFHVDEDQQNPGSYICTPASGVTFAEIGAALSKTKNVYASFNIPGQSTTLLGRFTRVSGDTAFFAEGLFFAGVNYKAYRLSIGNDDQAFFAAKALAYET